MTEAFRFSSRHSEFIKLKAEALLDPDQAMESPSMDKPAESHKYKIVI